MSIAIQHLAMLAQSNVAESFFDFDQNQRFVLMIIAIGCATAVICTVVGCVSTLVGSVHRRKAETDLKHELLDRGMSADEIAQVVESTQPMDFMQRWAAAQGKKRAS